MSCEISCETSVKEDMSKPLLQSHDNKKVRNQIPWKRHLNAANNKTQEKDINICVFRLLISHRDKWLFKFKQKKIERTHLLTIKVSSKSSFLLCLFVMINSFFTTNNL